MPRPKPKDHYILEIDRVSQTGNLIANCAHSFAHIPDGFGLEPGDLVEVEIVHVGGTVKVEVIDIVDNDNIDGFPPIRTFDGATIRARVREQQRTPEDNKRIKKKVEKRREEAARRIEEGKRRIDDLEDIAPSDDIEDQQDSNREVKEDTGNEDDNRNMNDLLRGKK